LSDESVDTLQYSADDQTTVDGSASEAVTGYELGIDRITFGTAGTDFQQVTAAANKYDANGFATGTVATNIAADTTLAAAITEAIGTTHADNDVFAFVYSGDTYVVHADATNAAGNIVQLVGVTGTSMEISGNFITIS